MEILLLRDWTVNGTQFFGTGRYSDYFILGTTVEGRATLLLELHDPIVAIRCGMAEEQDVKGNGVAQDFVVLGTTRSNTIIGLGFKK